MTTLLSMTSVDVHRGGSRVLSDVSLEVRAGEVVGLIGPNGAGKSTLLRAALGLVERTGGTVRVGDADPTRTDRLVVARRAVLLPERAAGGSGLSAREVVRTGRYAHVGPLAAETSADHAAVEAAMKATSTVTVADRAFDSLSAGERKRVLLARCFAQEAPLLLLDEPTSTLDASHARSLFDVIRERARGGSGALVAIHDLALAAASCDRLVALSSGRVIASGSPSEVLAGREVQALFGAEGALEIDDAEVRLRLPRAR